MNKFILALVVILAFLAFPREARSQETYSMTLSAAQVADVEWDRVRYNGDMCVSAGLPANCTLAQLRAVPGHSTDNLYGNTDVGRGTFLKQVWILDRLAEVRIERSRRDTSAFCIWWTALSQANKDTYCVTPFGLAVGCELCR
jgi:hypothetical protein